jgi:hypothetical protein
MIGQSMTKPFLSFPTPCLLGAIWSLRGRTWTALAAAMLACPAHAVAQNHAAAQDHADGIAPIFAMDASTGSSAQQAGGAPDPVFARGVSVVPDGASGPALALDGDLTLAWSAPGNIYAQRGTVAFAIRPDDAFDEAPVTLFRVASADSTSWDFTFLRIDWNGQGYDAFVTDTNLRRTRISWRSDTAPKGGDWVHIAFAWDEAQGASLWIDGKNVGHAAPTGLFDQALFGFGPFQRVISPQKTESAYNGVRAGQLDELLIYDRMLDDTAVARIAAGGKTVVAATPPRTPRTVWDRRYGWDHAGRPGPPAADEILSVRKVEFTDTRDQKARAFRGADGIRETTWPGVYNRSRLTGRTDYFILPDWNSYSTSGRRYDLTLPDEAWNRIEIAGAASGSLEWSDGTAKASAILQRPDGVERTGNTLTDRRGGTLSFVNAVPETPIQEIAAYRVRSVASLPPAWRQLDYTVDTGAAPTGYRALDSLTSAMRHRRPPDERAAVVALPDGAPRVAGSAQSGGQPVVTLMVPSGFRDQAYGGTASRFDYGWTNLDGGLDGILLTLPRMDGLVSADARQMTLNIRLHDPLWPDRDLVDVMIAVDPRRANRIWLDSRDRMLRSGDSIAMTIASDNPAFDAAALNGARVSLRFKPRREALAEHIPDRLEQARDQFASMIEEKPSSRLYPVYDRFERDVTDVLRFDPDNADALALWQEMNPEQGAMAGPVLPPVPDGVPAWAYRQTEALTLAREFVDWWIDHRQIGNGELGGGLSDDTDFVNQWVGLALMGVERERLIASQRAVLDATIDNDMWDEGINRITTDQLHTYEEGINTLAQAMMLTPDDPALIAMARDVVRQYPRIIRRNGAGHDHFASAWYSGSEIFTGGHLGRQYPYSFLITHPGLLLEEYHGSPAARSAILGALDGWLAHARRGPDGAWHMPAEIDWNSDAGTGSGVGPAIHDFWAAWLWTGDAKYLRAIAPAGLTLASASSLLSINADALAWLPGGDVLATRIADGALVGASSRFDPNLGTSSDAARARFIGWQMTGDNDALAALYAEDTARTRARWYVLTEAEPWTDRVAVPAEFLQRARLGGVALLRNAYFPGHLVEWRFSDPHAAERVGIMIPRGDPDHFRVIAHNLSDAPIRADMLGAMLHAGEWRMTSGEDGDGDNRADRAEQAAMVPLSRGKGVELAFPPHRTTVFEFTREGDTP